MRQKIGTALLSFLTLVCSSSIILGPAWSATVPSSVRSQESINRIKPSLTLALQNRGLHYGSPVFIRIFKESGELEVWIKGPKRFELFKTYPICTFAGELGPKRRVGDLQSPEGFYEIRPGQMNPHSQFHLSFDLGYPNAYDRAYGRTGSALMVHGNCVSIGCYAMTDEKIEEIYALADGALRKGQSSFAVHVFPFRLSAENLEKHKGSEWFGFWSNLKEGYDLFEKKGLPPRVFVANKRYIFK